MGVILSLKVEVNIAHGSDHTLVTRLTTYHFVSPEEYARDQGETVLFSINNFAP
jgi:hypothetical protein